MRGGGVLRRVSRPRSGRRARGGGETAEYAAALYEASAPYWPAAADWVYQQTQKGFLIVNTLASIYGKVANVVQGACNGLQ
jgi:hypothetical protein